MPAPEDLPVARGGALRRVGLVARQTLAEALRLRLTGLLAAAGALLVAMAWWLRALNFGHAELRFIGDFGLGAIGLMGTWLAAIATAHLFFSDLDGGVIGCLLTRRVRRGEYVAGKLAGVGALLALFVAGLAALLALIIAWREAELGAAYVPLVRLFQAGALVWLKVTLVAAMTLLVCSYAGSALFATCAGLMLALVAHLRPFTETSPGLGWLRLWPNLGLFDPEAVLTGANAGLPAVMLYWAVFLSVFTGLASYVFQRRDF